MMDSLLNTGHELVMDNWYSSLALMKELHERTCAYGTLRTNRKHVSKDKAQKSRAVTEKRRNTILWLHTSSPRMLGRQKLINILLK